MVTYKVAILTGNSLAIRIYNAVSLYICLLVSDTASLDAEQDKSGPIIQEILTDSKHDASCRFVTDTPVIVPDDIRLIQSTIKGWTLVGSYDWIITTGGTGFGPR